eukprot:sb/3467008/
MRLGRNRHDIPDLKTAILIRGWGNDRGTVHKTQVKYIAAWDVFYVNRLKLTPSLPLQRCSGSGTGQPQVDTIQLSFPVDHMFAIGSPLGLFLAVRGVHSFDKDFSLPTCRRFYNIFHPYDPVPLFASVPSFLFGDLPMCVRVLRAKWCAFNTADPFEQVRCLPRPRDTSVNQTPAGDLSSLSPSLSHSLSLSLSLSLSHTLFYFLLFIISDMRSTGQQLVAEHWTKLTENKGEGNPTSITDKRKDNPSTDDNCTDELSTSSTDCVVERSPSETVDTSLSQVTESFQLLGRSDSVGSCEKSKYSVCVPTTLILW